jgi:hypothetical protein
MLSETGKGNAKGGKKVQCNFIHDNFKIVCPTVEQRLSQRGTAELFHDYFIRLQVAVMVYTPVTLRQFNP